jgi:hypothetical protein
MNRLDWRGIAVFLGFTLVVGYALEAVFLYTGLIGAGKMGLFGQAAFMVLLFLPGLGAVIARQVGPVAPENESRLWPLPAVSTLRIIVAVPLVFAAVNLLLWLVGWTAPDLGVSELVYTIKQQALQPIPADAEPILPALLLLGGLGLSVTLGASLYAAIFFGMEYGWRGYLLPKLLPLGQVPALGISALGPFVLGLPAVVYIHLVTPEASDDLAMALVKYAVLSIGTGVLFGALWLRSRHLGLVALAAGSIAAHASGVWDALFPNDYLILTGSTGVVLSLAWFALGLVPGVLVGKRAG